MVRVPKRQKSNIINSPIMKQFQSMHMELRELYHVCYDIAPSEQVSVLQPFVTSVLDRLEMIEGFPRKKLEVLSVCYGMDTYLYMHDSSPVPSWRSIYQRMNGLFWKYAFSAGDPDWVSGLMCEQLRWDPLGLHLPLIAGCGDCFDDDHLIRIVHRFEEMARHSHPVDEVELRNSYLYLAGYVSRIIDQFDDFAEFVSEISDDEPSILQCLYIADCYADNAPEKSLDWLDRLGVRELSQIQQTYKLRILRTCFHTLEDFGKEESIARELLRRRYLLADAKQLFDCIPIERLDTAIAQEIDYCFQLKTIHPNILLFLSRYAQIDLLDRYVLSHVDALDEFAHEKFVHADILPYAMNLAEHGFYMSATVLYRVLVLNVLARKLDNGYLSRGCDYLIRLGTMAPWVRSWRALGFSHVQFVRFLRKNYGESTGFWDLYDEQKSKHGC